MNAGIFQDLGDGAKGDTLAIALGVLMVVIVGNTLGEHFGFQVESAAVVHELDDVILGRSGFHGPLDEIGQGGSLVKLYLRGVFVEVFLAITGLGKVRVLGKLVTVGFSKLTAVGVLGILVDCGHAVHDRVAHLVLLCAQTLHQTFKGVLQLHIYITAAAAVQHDGVFGGSGFGGIVRVVLLARHNAHCQGNGGGNKHNVQ